MKIKYIIENLLLEASKKDILINKMGVNEYNAEALSKVAGPLTVFFAYKILEKYEKQVGYDTPKDIKERMALVNGSNSFVREKSKVVSIMDWVRVEMNGNIKPYESLTFEELYSESEKWHESLGIGESKIDYEEKNEIVLDFRKNGEGLYWANLGVRDCSEESERMGHCGRSSGIIYSLREFKKIQNNHTLNKSHLTASVTDSGEMLQLKGPKNSKPKDEYHPYIIPFLLSSIVERTGSEYSAKNDFVISDLTDDEIKMLYEKKPQLFETRRERKVLYDLGLIEKPKIPEFVWLEIEPRNVEDYVNGDYVVSKRKNSNGNTRNIGLFETILSGDLWDVWENHDANWEDGVYYMSRESEVKINEILKKFAGDEFDDSLSLVDAIEEYDSDDNIKDAIRWSINDAESSDYHDHIYKTLKDCLYEYGVVEKMNDEGVVIKADYRKLIEDSDIDGSDLDDIMDECGEDPQCVLNEMMYNGHIIKPKFYIDDRWSPDVDHDYFNDVLKDRLYDI